MPIKVKCVQCKATKEIREGEIPSGDYPLCDKCYMPMIPVSAKTETKKKK